MSQSRGRKASELAALLVAAAFASAIVVGASSKAPQPPAAAPATPAESFTAICAADAAKDTSRDPAWVLVSFENDHCQAPPMPAALNGRAATREEIVAGMAAVKRFAARSDAFQKCVSDFAAARAAPGSRTAQKAFLLVENHRIQVSEKNKKKAAVQMAAAIEAFNAYGSECPE